MIQLFSTNFIHEIDQFFNEKIFVSCPRYIFHFVLGNALTYQGVVCENQTSQTDVLQSPFFPNFYPRDLTVEHLIECSSNDSSECHIEISFTDFQIAIPSIMEVSNEHLLLFFVCFDSNRLIFYSFTMIKINW